MTHFGLAGQSLIPDEKAVCKPIEPDLHLAHLTTLTDAP